MFEGLLRNQSRDLRSEAGGDVGFVNYQSSIRFFHALEHSLAIERYQRAQIDYLDRRAFLFKRPRYLDSKMHRSAVADN